MIVVCQFLLVCALIVPCFNCSEAKYNVLFIMSEDLRPELPQYGRHHVYAPNIRRLEEKSTIFDYAVAQISVCAPSRASLLTGLRPDTLGIYDFSHFGGINYFRTIPSHFHRSGYVTAMSGKLFHWDSPLYYSFDYWGSPSWESMQNREALYQNSSVTPDDINPSSIFRDVAVANNAIRILKRLQLKKNPWFLAVGFKGTHLPYHMPLSYWQVYENSTFPPYEQDSFSFPMSSPGLHYLSKAESMNIRFMKSIGKERWNQKENYMSVKKVSSRGRSEIYRGYLSCISFMDHELGKLLDVVDRLSLWNNTIIVFTSDHGMHLGEKGMWTKWTLFDESTRVPLMIHAPQFKGSYGKHVSSSVELIDIFPTLVDLASVPLEVQCPTLPMPQKKEDQGIKLEVKGESRVENSFQRIFRHVYCDKLDGKSLINYLASFESSSSLPSFKKSRDTVDPLEDWKFSITQKMSCKNPGNHELEINSGGIWTDYCPFKKLPRDPVKGVMGYSLRFLEWRYTAWLLFSTESFLPALDLPPLVEELYDHRQRQNGSSLFLSTETFHPEMSELVNVAHSSEYQPFRERFRKLLYDYLWENMSFEHLFQKRQQSFPTMATIIQGRYHDNPHPLRKHVSKHFYQI